MFRQCLYLFIWVVLLAFVEGFNSISNFGSRTIRTSIQKTRIRNANFDEFLSNMDVPVLVDFYAEWCGPCKQMKPVLSEVATKLEGIAKVAKIDTDKAPKLSEKYGIRALPTLILFNKNEVVERFEGYRSAEEVESLVRKAITTMNT